MMVSLLWPLSVNLAKCATCQECGGKHQCRTRVGGGVWIVLWQRYPNNPVQIMYFSSTDRSLNAPSATKSMSCAAMYSETQPAFQLPPFGPFLPRSFQCEREPFLPDTTLSARLRIPFSCADSSPPLGVEVSPPHNVRRAPQDSTASTFTPTYHAKPPLLKQSQQSSPKHQMRKSTNCQPTPCAI